MFANDVMYTVGCRDAACGVSWLQYLFDAGESEAWMSEQELHMISEERARDEVGAGNMLKKHANMEKTVDDYADVVRQLADRANQLIEQDHPDKSVPTLQLHCIQTIGPLHFYSTRNARIAGAVLSTAIPSVRPSVCPSVRHMPVLCQNDGT